jgi:hypothetical protein
VTKSVSDFKALSSRGLTGAFVNTYFGFMVKVFFVGAPGMITTLEKSFVRQG